MLSILGIPFVHLEDEVFANRRPNITVHQVSTFKTFSIFLRLFQHTRVTVHGAVKPPYSSLQHKNLPSCQCFKHLSVNGKLHTSCLKLFPKVEDQNIQTFKQSCTTEVISVKTQNYLEKTVSMQVETQL